MGNIKNDAIRLMYECCPNQVTATRIPYTYHHDYCRTYTERFRHSSRSDVAAVVKDVNEDHLYSIAFLFVFTTMTNFEVINLPRRKIDEIYQLVKIALNNVRKLEEGRF